MSKITLFLIITAAIFIPSHLIIATQTNPLRFDYLNYYSGALLFSRQPDHLYNLPVLFALQDKILGIHSFSAISGLPFRTLPFVAYLFYPLTHYSYVTSYYIYVSILLITLFALGKLVLNLFPSLKKIHLLLLLFSFSPVIITILQGQITLFIVFTLLLTFRFLKQEKPFIAGLICPLLLLKPQYYVISLLLLSVISHHRRQFIFGNIITSVLILIFNLLLVEPSMLFQYFSFLIHTESPLYGSVLRYSSAFPWYVTVILFPFLLYYLNKNRSQHSLVYSFLITSLLIVPLSIHSLVGDAVILLIPLLILFNSPDSRAFPMLVSLFLLSNIFIYLSPPALGIISFIFAVYLLFIPQSLIINRKT